MKHSSDIPPKSRTFALDTSVRQYYHILRQNKYLTIKGGNQNPGKPPRPDPRHRPREIGGLNALTHPNTYLLSCRGDRPIAPLARQAGCGTSDSVIPETSGTPPPHPTGLVPPSLSPGRWKDALDRSQADRPSPAERPSRRSVCSELALYQDRGGGLASPAPDKLPVVGPSASLRHTESSITWGRWGTRDLRVRHVIETPGG